MSAENVEVVRRFADHWVHGEWTGLEARRDYGLGDRVVLLHREYQRGRGSGVELQIEAAGLS